MNKKGEGEFLILLIFLALIPMCSHAGETSYSQCKEDCVKINFNKMTDENYTTHYYSNQTEIQKDFILNYCHDECKENK